MVQSSFNIYLDSRDSLTRGSPYPNSDFSFNLPAYDIQVGNSVGVSLESCVIPVLEYNINEENNKIYLVENDGPVIEVTIPPANYTAETLVTELKTFLDNAGSLTYTITYSEQTSKFEIEVLLPNFFRFEAGPNNVYEVLGFLSTGTSNAAAAVSPYPVRLDGTEYIDVQLLGVPNENIHSSLSGYRDVLARVPITSNFGSVLYYVNPDNNNFVITESDTFYRIRMRLIKPNGELYKIPSNAFVSVVLRCETLKIY